MPNIGEWIRRIWYFLNRRRLERELERELAAHRAEIGDPRRFGSSLRIREQSADVWGWTWIDDLVHDLRYGARQLRRAPGFAAIALLTLTLGIGANTAVFSIINGDFFVYAPVRDPGSLRTLEWADAFRSSNTGRAVPYDAFLSVTKARSLASAACATDTDSANIGLGTSTFSGPVQRVTSGYFHTLGVVMAQGRALTAADDRRGAAPVAVISDGMWRRRLASAPDAVGRQITVDGAPVTIVGVTPPGFYARSRWRRVDVMLVMHPPALPAVGDKTLSSDEGRCQPIVRLAAHISDEQLQAEATSLLRPFIVDQPRASRAPAVLRFTVRANRFGRGIDDVDRDFIRNEAAVILAAGFLLATMLVIPCANIAGIMLARAVTRQREITTRMAMGAGRGRIVRQLLTEGLLLSSAAGVLGVVLSHFLFLALRNANGPGPVVIDPRVLLYSAGLCLVTALGFALLPALRATRIDLTPTLRDSPTGGFGRSRVTTAKVLTAVQVVLASLLLIGVAVQGRTMLGVLPPRGVEPERVTLVVAALGGNDRAATPVRRALEQLGSLPGVEVASAVHEAEVGEEICGQDLPGRQEVIVNIVSPGFLRSTRIPLREGRDVRWDDGKTAIINRSLAKLLFGERSPIGRTVRLIRCQDPLTIVGVIEDSRNAIGPAFSGRNGIDPTMYVPLSSGVLDLTFSGATFFVRAHAAPVPADTLARVVREADATAKVLVVTTQAQLLASARRGLQTVLSLLAGVSLLAVFQAAFGIYAVLSHFVSRRTAEIGIRTVLGATPIDLIRLVVRQSLAPVLLGLGIAVGLTPVAVSVMARARLAGPLDAGEQITLLVPVLALLLAAFAAACGPALRATRIAPSITVRVD